MKLPDPEFKQAQKQKAKQVISQLSGIGITGLIMIRDEAQKRLDKIKTKGKQLLDEID